MFLTFAEYTAYGGTITDEVKYNDFEFGARSLINKRTFNRMKDWTEFPEAVKRLMFKLINLAQKQEEALSLGASASGSTETRTGAYITSQSNDGVSVSYNSMSTSSLYELVGDEINNAIDTYLQDIVDNLGRKVLYRGLYPGE